MLRLHLSAGKRQAKVAILGVVTRKDGESLFASLRCETRGVRESLPLNTHAPTLTLTTAPARSVWERGSLRCGAAPSASHSP